MALPLLPLALMAGGGAALGGLGALTSKKGKFQQTPLYNPQQQSAFSNILSQGLGNQDFGAIENRARSQFNSQTVPSLAERFTSMGGGQRSSAFQGALGNAGAGLEEGLAALRSQHGLQQTSIGLTPQFENNYFPSQPGFFEGLSSGFNQGLPSMLGAWGQGAFGGGNKFGGRGGAGQGGINPAQLQQLLAMLGGQ